MKRGKWARKTEFTMQPDGSVVRGLSCYSEPAYDVRIQDGRIELRLRDEVP